FFDDYSNSVVVGTSMRPLTDKLKIAREKLAYLIDSTAAPIAVIALFSTWIGYEVSQYDAALRVVDPARAEEAYSIFLMTIPLRFYCIFTLAFVLVNVFTSRDYGPMLAAERRSASTGKVIRDGARPLTSTRFAKLTPAEGVTPRAFNAIFPLAVVVGVMLLGFWFVGGGVIAFKVDGWGSFSLEGLGNILGNDYTMHVAVVASAVGSLLAIGLALRAIPFPEALRAWSVGFSSLIVAILILISAWALAQACGDLRAGQYLVASVGSDLPLVVQPIVFFVLACLIAFATGTSWGTMAILIPIAIPLAYYSEGLVPGDPLAGTITLLSFGAVLEGSIFGDHCSPISDTTVLSSVSAGSDHLDHVKTQIPYAMTTMGIALLIGYLPVGLGWYGPTVAIPLGIIACVVILLVVGKKLPEALPEAESEPPASDPAEASA
ncbi:MAG: Na+/H+ antiporter NhaC family protein, partial [Planctomycetota bacterium]